MDPLTVFALLAVTAMLVTYALEERSVGPGLCRGLPSGVYGFLKGAWPFGVLEAVWVVVPAGRWHSRAFRCDGLESPDFIG